MKALQIGKTNLWPDGKWCPNMVIFGPNIIELDDGKIYRKPLYLMVKTMVSYRISLKPIHWKYCCPWWPDRWSEHLKLLQPPLPSSASVNLCAQHRQGRAIEVPDPRPISLAPGNGGRAMGPGQPVIYSGSRNIEAMLREHGWDFWVFLKIWLGYIS